MPYSKTRRRIVAALSLVTCLIVLTGVANKDRPFVISAERTKALD